MKESGYLPTRTVCHDGIASDRLTLLSYFASPTSKPYRLCKHHMEVVNRAYQSKPSKRPSPFKAEVLKIAHWRFLILCNSKASVIAASSSAPGRSYKPGKTQSLDCPSFSVPQGIDVCIFWWCCVKAESSQHHRNLILRHMKHKYNSNSTA